MIFTNMSGLSEGATFASEKFYILHQCQKIKFYKKYLDMSND
jgi:hypothetical protein